MYGSAPQDWRPPAARWRLQDQSGKGLPLWDFYNGALSRAKYIDLTHAIAPGGPLGEGFVDFTVGPTRAGVSIPGIIDKGEPFSYEKHGVAITAYELPMDHIGTQFGPPAHRKRSRRDHQRYSPHRGAAAAGGDQCRAQGR